jgi:hypothetical protein
MKSNFISYFFVFETGKNFTGDGIGETNNIAIFVNASPFSFVKMQGNKMSR